MLSERTGEPAAPDVAQWTHLLQQQSRQRREEAAFQAHALRKGAHALREGGHEAHPQRYASFDAIFSLHPSHVPERGAGMLEFSGDGAEPLQGHTQEALAVPRHASPAKRRAAAPKAPAGVSKRAGGGGAAALDSEGTWGEDSKRALLVMVAKYSPRGAKDWSLIAEALGRPQGGQSAERMYR